MMGLSPQQQSALVRGIGGAFVSAGISFFALVGVDLVAAGIAAGASAFGYLGLRFGIEGTIDARRARVASNPEG